MAPSDCVGWDVIVEKSLSLCMPSFLFQVQFWKATRLVKIWGEIRLGELGAISNNESGAISLICHLSKLGYSHSNFYNLSPSQKWDTHRAISKISHFLQTRILTVLIVTSKFLR